MRRSLPFALKLGFSFALVILVSVALVYFLNARAITTQFAQFREQSKQQIARQVCGLLAEYRLRNGTWLGIERLLSTQYSVFFNGQWVVRRTSLIGSPFLLADVNGKVVVSTEAERVGTSLSEKELTAGIPIETLRHVPRPALSGVLFGWLVSALYRGFENRLQRRFWVDEHCSDCRLCARICPTGNIYLPVDRPVFGDRCQLCMRCIHNCPEQAIQIGRATVGKFRWSGPKGQFKALGMRPPQG